MKILLGLTAIPLLSLGACSAIGQTANNVVDGGKDAVSSLNPFSDSASNGANDVAVTEAPFDADEETKKAEAAAKKAAHPLFAELDSWDERYISMELDERTRLPHPSEKRMQMPKTLETFEQVVAIQPGWVPVGHKEPDRAGLGLVLAVHGYQMRLKHVMAELEGSSIYGRVENAVNAEIGDEEKTEKERAAIRERIVRGLDAEDQKAFRDLVVANRQEMTKHLAMIGGDVVFWTQGAEGIEGFLGDLGDAVDRFDFVKLQKVTAQTTLAMGQVKDLRKVRGLCIEEAEKLDARLAAWDNVVEEL